MIESPLMISGMLNEETVFEARQRKAKVKWDYLLQFGKCCTVSQSIDPSCFVLYSLESQSESAPAAAKRTNTTRFERHEGLQDLVERIQPSVQ